MEAFGDITSGKGLEAFAGATRTSRRQQLQSRDLDLAWPSVAYTLPVLMTC